MNVNVIESSKACADLRRILDYFIGQQEDTVASRFLDAYEETLGSIADFPELASTWESDVPRLNSLRVKLIRGFEKYLVFFRLVEQTAYVVRVVHGHQNLDNVL